MPKFTSIDEIYAAVPELDCQGKCQECCGVVPLFPVEADRIRERENAFPYSDENLTCTALKAGRCSIYANRPLICRLWGNLRSKGMQCPWGCKPKQYLSDRQAQQLLDGLHRLGNGKPAEVHRKPRTILEL